MALAILAEALARIEHKVDLALKRLSFLDPTPVPLLHFVGSTCPVCTQSIDYQIDVTHGVVVRRCGCKTGKLPPLIPIIPIPVGAQNGNPATDQPTSRDERTTEDGGRRKAR